MNLVARPADHLAATWPQLTELEMDGFKSEASESSKNEGVTRAHLQNEGEKFYTMHHVE